jgi:hypothetical protein
MQEIGRCTAAIGLLEARLYAYSGIFMRIFMMQYLVRNRGYAVSSPPSSQEGFAAHFGRSRMVNSLR